VDNNGVTTQAITLPFYTSRAAVTANGGTAPFFSSRVDPRTGVINGNSSTADSRYNGLIFSLRKPLSHHVEMLANYTLSKATDNGQQGGGNSGEGQVGIPAIDPFDNTLEQGTSGTDVRHRFTTSVVLQPDLDRIVPGKLAKTILGGWQMSTTFTAQTGGHYTALINSSTSKAATFTGCLPGQNPCAPTTTTTVGGVTTTTPSTLTTFTYVPLDGAMGGAGVNSPGANFAGRAAWIAPGSFVLPNLYNVDMRLEKVFNLTERFHLSLRGEAFNVFNSTLTQQVNQVAYDYATPASTASTPASQNFCPTGTVGTIGALTPHTNTCMSPVSTFGSASTTSGNLLGARQLQAGIRFEF